MLLLGILCLGGRRRRLPKLTQGRVERECTRCIHRKAKGPTDAAELEAFLDDLFAAQMEEKHIPGAAVTRW